MQEGAPEVASWGEVEEFKKSGLKPGLLPAAQWPLNEDCDGPPLTLQWTMKRPWGPSCLTHPAHTSWPDAKHSLLSSLSGPTTTIRPRTALGQSPHLSSGSNPTYSVLNIQTVSLVSPSAWAEPMGGMRDGGKKQNSGHREPAPLPPFLAGHRTKWPEPVSQSRATTPLFFPVCFTTLQFCKTIPVASELPASTRYLTGTGPP